MNQDWILWTDAFMGCLLEKHNSHSFCFTAELSFISVDTWTTIIICISLQNLQYSTKCRHMTLKSMCHVPWYNYNYWDHFLFREPKSTSTFTHILMHFLNTSQLWQNLYTFILGRQWTSKHPIKLYTLFTDCCSISFKFGNTLILTAVH
jgi:hypothetical protein